MHVITCVDPEVGVYRAYVRSEVGIQYSRSMVMGWRLELVAGMIGGWKYRFNVRRLEVTGMVGDQGTRRLLGLHQAICMVGGRVLGSEVGS